MRGVIARLLSNNQNQAEGPSNRGSQRSSQVQCTGRVVTAGSRTDKGAVERAMQQGFGAACRLNLLLGFRAAAGNTWSVPGQARSGVWLPKSLNEIADGCASGWLNLLGIRGP